MKKKNIIKIPLFTLLVLFVSQSAIANESTIKPEFTEVTQFNLQSDRGLLSGISASEPQEKPWFGRELTTYNTGHIDAFGHPHLEPLFIGMDNGNYVRFLFDVKNNKPVVDTNLCQYPGNKRKGGGCREPEIWEMDTDGLYLIYYNKDYLPEDELYGNLYNYTYLYDSRVSKSVFVEGMVIGLVDLDKDGKKEIITYKREKRYSKEKGTISAYSIENPGKESFFVKKVSSGKTSHAINGVVKHPYGRGLDDIYTWDLEIQNKYVEKYSTTFLMDQQTSGLFIAVKKRSKEQIKVFRQNRKEVYGGGGENGYYRLGEYFASRNKKLYPVPVGDFKSYRKDGLDKIYGLYGVQDVLYPKNAYLEFKDFNRIRIDKTDHDLMILDSLDNFSCGEGSVGKNFYCDSTDGYAQGQYVLEKGYVLNFGFFPDVITFIDFNFKNRKIAMGVNKNKIILFAGNLDAKIESQVSRMDWYWRFANLNYSPLKQLEIIPAKNVLGYTPELLISYYDNLYTIDPEWNFHIYKATVVEGKKGSAAKESW